MSSQLRYWIKVASAEPVTCESLGLAPAALTFSSLAPDEATLIRYPNSTALAHDTPVRLYAQASNGTLTQVFVGRVNSPEDVANPSGSASTLRIAGGFAGWEDFTFTRSFGSNISTLLVMYRASGQFLQDLKQAVVEVATLAQTRLTALDGWNFSFSASNVNLGASPLQPQADWEDASSCLDWCVKALRPQLDAWARFDHKAANPVFACGRFRDVPGYPVTDDTPPLISRRIRRDYSQEVSGLTIGLGTEGEALPGIGLEVLTPLYASPTGQTANSRRNMPLTMADIPDAWNAGVGNALTASITKPWIEGGLTFSIAGDVSLLSQIRPGQVLVAGGRRLNVQTTTADLRAGTLTATGGPPRQLGINDLFRLTRWLYVTRGTLTP